MTKIEKFAMSAKQQKFMYHFTDITQIPISIKHTETEPMFEKREIGVGEWQKFAFINMYITEISEITQESELCRPCS